MSKQTDLLKSISAKVRKRGIKPFTKAFGRAMKEEFKKLKRTRITRSNPRKPKSKSSKRKTNKTSKKNTNPKKSLAGKKGTSGMTRAKKLLLGLGVGALFSTLAALTRIREIEGAAPIIDAAVGGGVEAQVGTAIPRLIRIVAGRVGLNGNGGNGGGVGGA